MPLIEAPLPYGHGIDYQSLLSSLQSDSPSRKRRRIALDGEARSTNAPESLAQGGSQGAAEVEPQSSDSETEDENTHDVDPFHIHFEDPNARHLACSIAAIQNSKWMSSRHQGSAKWSSISLRPDCHADKDADQDDWPATKSPIKSLKTKIRGRVMSEISALDTIMQKTRDILFNYEDLSFTLRSYENAGTLRQLACAHTLNHLLKTRDRILKNNGRSLKDAQDSDMELRDQGFTRPKVLILLPTRQACVRYADVLVSLFNPEQLENRKRFQESFSARTGDLDEKKPDDFRELFEGNDDDLFRLGIKFTRKNIKFFSKFYNSDIILASPLGLRMAMSKGERKSVDYDFLSSIEILVLDQADALYMQNWEHVEFIIDHIGLQPQEAHGCDFSRVRNWYLDGNAKFTRQNIAFSSYNFAPLNRLFISSMSNFAGKHKIMQHVEGIIAEMSIIPKQTFSRVQFANVNDEPDERFRFLTQALLPTLNEDSKSSKTEAGFLIFIPTYADFLRVRNYLAAAPNMQDISFGAISEYTPVKEVARARTLFLSGRHSLLLYTERVHHFRRYNLKGVKRIVMYAPPENPVFYKEIVEGFLGSSLATGKITPRELEVKVVFSRLDVLKIERIVGTDRHKALLDEEGDTFDFVG